MVRYEDLIDQLQQCPDTWTAALFLVLLKRVIEREIFNNLIEVVEKVQKKLSN